MNRLFKVLVLVLLCSLYTNHASARAGFGMFFSSAPTPTKTLTPGETFPVTLTANTDQIAGILFSSPFAFNPNGGNQFSVVAGGTCNTLTSYSNGQTCTVLVKFTGSTPGSFTGNLLGQCQFSAQLGGYSINCANNTQGVLGQFVGNGLAAVVDALGGSGLSLLMLAVLGIGAFVTLRRTA